MIVPKADFDQRHPPLPKPKPELEALVVTHLVNAIQFGTITIRYQNGRPTHVERNEIIRLTDDARTA